MAEEKKIHTYRCRICGFIYKSEEPLSDDFVCPICGVPASEFEEIEDE